MADSPRSTDKGARPSSKNKPVRSQKIIQLSAADTRPQNIPEDSELLHDINAPSRTHTPGHLSSKSQDRRKKGASDLSLRQRSQSLSQKDSSSSSLATSSKSAPNHANSTAHEARAESAASASPKSTGASCLIATTPEPRRPLNLRSTSAIASKPSATGNSSPTSARQSLQTQRPMRGPSTPFPPLPDPKKAPNVKPAPASGMYWSRAPVSGASHTSLRAHTTTLIGSNIYIFGGCDSRSCFNEVYVLDADAFYFSSPFVCGEIPVPLRAMTCTAVGKKLVIFGGGDGPSYSNDVYVLDTVNFRWSKPKIGGDRTPSKRRAHTACLYKNGIYIFGGGDGVQALNDVWRLDVTDTTKMTWKLISAPTTPSGPDDRSKPQARGYHTANMISSKLIIFGGSDGGECFRDVWVFDVDTLLFSPVNIPVSYPRLSHTATIVGSYLFVIGGHDGVEYSNEVLLLNLVTMVWDKRKIYGHPPKARGYHGAVLHDSRLVVVGGFDGSEVYGDVWIMELAVHAYYSQISHFSIDV